MKKELFDFIGDHCGGAAAVAEQTGLSTRAVYKWTARGSLPRTEYTGETSYSNILSDMSGIDVEVIKERFNPLRTEPADA